MAIEQDARPLAAGGRHAVGRLGVLLVVAPLPGAVVMTYWLAVYAVIFGVALLAAGWHARQINAA